MSILSACLLLIAFVPALGHPLKEAERGKVQQIVVVPMGIDKPESLEFLRGGIEESFSIPCRMGKTVKLPEKAYNKKRRQYLSTALLRELEKVKAGEGAVKIGVADVDLYVPGLNFVFGEAVLGGTACVISLRRLRQEIYCLPADKDLFESRALTEAVHELGHTFDLRHCSNPRCVMYFSNSLVDTDRKGYKFCDRCRKKMGIGKQEANVSPP